MGQKGAIQLAKHFTDRLRTLNDHCSLHNVALRGVVTVSTVELHEYDRIVTAIYGFMS